MYFVGAIDILSTATGAGLDSPTSEQEKEKLISPERGRKKGNRITDLWMPWKKLWPV
jgi:hypothetical protein